MADIDSKDFSHWGKEMVDFICEYLDTIQDQNVIPSVEPGYLRPMLPTEAPEDGEEWKSIFSDVKKLIIPGLTHWQHPRFHAYFPAANSTPSIMGEMLSTALGCIGFSWAASPAITELEIVMMDWVARLLKLPEEFTHESGKGGGVIQSSASDSILVSMLAARRQAIEKHKANFKHEPNPETAVLSRLVAYCSTQSHSCVDKASMICFVRLRQVEPGDDFSMTGSQLQSEIEACATLGSTGCCAFDDLASIGPVCDKNSIWLHIDGAYAGNSFICPEFRHYLNGVENASSMNMNPNKWMLVSFDCSLMWVKNRRALTESMVVDPVYLQHKHSSKSVDFRHVEMAQLFASKVRNDERFEIVGNPVAGLVCFRLKGSNMLNKYLIRAINESLQLHVVPAVAKETYFIRFALCREGVSEEDIEHAWNGIILMAIEILAAKDALDNYRLCLAHSTNPVMGTTSDMSLEELYTSDESNCYDECSRDTHLVHDMEEKLTKLANYRLSKLKNNGEMDAHKLLSQFLHTLGWESGKYGVELPNTTASLISFSKREDVSVSSRHAGEKEDGHVENGCFKMNGQDGSTQGSMSHGNETQESPKPSCTPNQIDSPDGNKMYELSIPNFKDGEYMKKDIGSIAQTSSPLMPLQQYNRTNSDTATKPTTESGDVTPSSPGGITDNLFPSLGSANTLDSKESPVVKNTDSLLSMKQVESIYHMSSSSEGASNEAHVCERDLGVGMIHTKTLTKLRRQTLIRMLSENPIGMSNQYSNSSGSQDDDSDSCKKKGWKQQVREFNDMLVSMGLQQQQQHQHQAGIDENAAAADGTGTIPQNELITRRTVQELFSAVPQLAAMDNDQTLVNL